VVCAMMTDDPQSIVATGYDLIAEAYPEQYGRSLIRDKWLGKLITLLLTKYRVLDLGCGSGVPLRASWRDVDMTWSGSMGLRAKCHWLD